jgi:hypothetical protein
VLTAQIRKFNVNAGAWFLDEHAYLGQQRLAKKPPDIRVLVKYQRQRQALVMNAHSSIHGALTPAGWTNLYGYINGSFKTALSQAQGATK